SWTEVDKYWHAPPGTAFAKIQIMLSGGSGSVLFDNVGMTKAEGTFLISALGESIPVSNLEDISEPMSPEQFWGKFPEIPLSPPQDSIWTVPTLRNFFQGFGKWPGGDFQFDTAERIAERDLHIPVVEGALGQVADPFSPIVIAGDIEYR